MADDRTYIRVHDGMPGHPKVRGLSDKAFRTMVSAWCYCSEYLTDGEVVADIARDLGTKKTWEELVRKGIAEPAPDGYLMHDYLQHQRSAAEVAEIKAGRGAGGTLGNHVRWHVKRRRPDPTCEHCNPIAPIANGSQERWDSDSDGISQGNRSGSHSQRQRQIQNNNSSKGGSHVSSGSADEPPLYPDRCKRHSNTYDPPNCGQCADVRKARLQLASIGPHNPATKPHCGECDAARLLTTRFGTIPCPNCNPAAERSA